MQYPTIRRRSVALVAAALAVGSLAACSSSGKTGGSTTHATHPATTASTPAAPPANTLSITAKDTDTAMSYDISGSPRPGLVAITFTNAGDDTHEMGVSMMKPGVTLDQLKTALKSKDGEQQAQGMLLNPDAEYPVPAPLGPGGSETEVTSLAAGHYVVVCFFPGDDGMPHALMGMIGEFTVGGDASTAQPPSKTDGTIEVTDSGITVPSGFGKGGTYEVTNTGTKPHDFSLAKLSGKSLMDLFQCVESSFGKGQPIDKCPGKLAGGVNTLQPGKSAYLTITLTPGDYGYVSTEGDGADVKAGLAGTFTVK